jgi:hypothetical protein
MLSATLPEIIGGIVVAAVLALLSFFSIPWAALWQTLGTEYIVPLWLCILAWLSFGAWIVFIICRYKAPAFERQFTAAQFDGIIWKWRYVSRAPTLPVAFCAKERPPRHRCNTKLMITADQASRTTRFSCVNCNRVVTSIDGQSEAPDVADHVRRRVEAAIENGEWREVAKDYRAFMKFQP